MPQKQICIQLKAMNYVFKTFQIILDVWEGSEYAFERC